ncbi:MAG: hypothetical protein VZQ98_05475 [Bacteroidales bacterium]|nr:hypothetical protein [Bacteroidales bacterium]
MKKSFLFMLFVALCNMLQAKDLIVTTDKESIDAKIIEVSDEEVKYKKLNNLNGPTFVLKTSKIYTVVYENGDVQVFTPSASTQEQVKVPEAQNAENIGNAEDLATPNYLSLSPVTRDRGLNGKHLSDKEWGNYLKDNCTIAYDQWNRGCKGVKKGWTFFIVGSALRLTGIASLIAASNYYGGYYYWDSYDNCYYHDYDYGLQCGLFIYGFAATTVGSSLRIASIPLLATGYSRKRKSINTYNENCANRSAAQLGLNVNSNGLGLSLNF